MEAAVRTSGLRKAFRGTVALHGLDLVVPAGSVFGYLGPNGAGKTTTIRLLTGLLRPTAGRAEVLGLDVATHPDEVQRRVGYLPGRFVGYPDLTGAEYLRYLAALRGGVDWSEVDGPGGPLRPRPVPPARHALARQPAEGGARAGVHAPPRPAGAGRADDRARPDHAGRVPGPGGRGAAGRGPRSSCPPTSSRRSRRWPTPSRSCVRASWSAPRPSPSCGPRWCAGGT